MFVDLGEILFEDEFSVMVLFISEGEAVFGLPLFEEVGLGLALGKEEGGCADGEC